MTRFHILLAAGVGVFALVGFSAPPSAMASQAVKASDVSAAQSATKKRKTQPPAVQHVPPRQAVPESAYRSGPDPSLGPDGRPYPVPEYLRGQCYMDDGYGRFSPCSNI